MVAVAALLSMADIISFLDGSFLFWLRCFYNWLLFRLSSFFDRLLLLLRCIILVVLSAAEQGVRARVHLELEAPSALTFTFQLLAIWQIGDPLVMVAIATLLSMADIISFLDGSFLFWLSFYNWLLFRLSSFFDRLLLLLR